MQPKIDHFEAVRGPANGPGGPGDSITQTTIGGVPVYAFNVRPGDVQSWDRVEGNVGPNAKSSERAEISYAPAPDTAKSQSPVNVREGMLQTYDVDYWFKPGFPPHVSANHEWAVLTQFHPQPNNKGIPGFGGATFHDGAITFDSPTGDGSVFARMPIKADGTTKHPIRMAVKWSSGKDGYAMIQNRETKQILGRYDGPTIAPGEFKYLKRGYYRAGGLPEATVYQSVSFEISDGDLTATATTPAPATKKNSAPLDPSKPSVQPNDGAAALMQIRDQLVALKDPRVQPQIDAANKVLDASAWTP